MENNVQMKINRKSIPLNQFVTTIVSKLVLAIVESLKGTKEEDIKEVIIEVKY
ncbi:MAG: hypothetical protein ACXABK_05465 [Candidatus Heimdallarchaeaceae archaeon]